MSRRGSEPPTVPVRPLWRLGLGALGVAAIGFGAVRIVTGGIATDRAGTAVWLLAGVLAHDLLIVPVVAVAGWLLARLAPPAVRPAVQGGLLVAGVLVLVSLPVLSGRGGRSNPTSNPLDYPRNLGLALAAVAVGTVLVMLWSVRLRRRRAATADGRTDGRG